MMPPSHYQRGATLIEAMIGITIGLIILAGVLALSAQTSSSGIQSIRMARLNQELRATMDIIAKDLERAGYTELWLGGANSVDDIKEDRDRDALLVFGDISIPGTDCVLFSYDLNGDGSQGYGSATISASDAGFRNAANYEMFGYWYTNNEIRTRRGGVNGNCVTADTWQAMTFDDIEITAFSVQFDSFDDDDPTTTCLDPEIKAGVCTYLIDGADCTTSGDVCYDRRVIAISITGQVLNDPTTSTTLNASVKVKNDYFYEIP